MKEKKKCSKWCGHGCTQREFDAAVKRAEHMVRVLGPSWRPVVWENMGWHAKAVSRDGFVKVHDSHPAPFLRPITFTAFMGEGLGGNWVGHGDTPAAAVRDAAKLFAREQRKLARYLARVEDALSHLTHHVRRLR